MLLAEWHASHTSSISFSLNVGNPITTSFDCIALSFLRLMWPIRLCYNFTSESTFVLFANMADFISCESRMNIRPSMSRPSFSMKQPPWSNRTCIPCSTIWPTETKFFVMVGTCKTFLMYVCLPFSPNRTLPMCRIGCVVLSPVST